MNKKIINEILLKYQQKRNKALMLSEQAKQEAYKIEDFANLDKQERLLIMQIGKLKFENKDYSALENQINIILKEKEKVLTQNNINSTTLTPNFECKICNDTGFVKDEMCRCLKQNYNNEIMRLSNIDIHTIPQLSNYNSCCFDSEERKYVDNIVDKLKIFAQNLSSAQTKNLILVGGTGVGKTYLAQSLAKEVLQYNHTVLFISAFNLNNNFLKIHTSQEINKTLLLQNFIDVDLLIIDDLGTEPMLRNVTKEYLLLLINERLNSNKHTIFTTNLMPDNILTRYDERLYSRLFNKQNCTLFNLKGKDLRVTK